MSVRLAIPHWREAPRPSNQTLANGLRYEARVTRWLVAAYNFHPQVEFENGSKRFRPDGLLFDSAFSRLCVVEIKNQHSQEGVGQLQWYMRWLREWFPGEVSGLLVCQTYRPEIVGELVVRLEDVLEGAYSLGVLAIGAKRL